MRKNCKKKLETSQELVDTYLRDSFNTPDALQELLNLVSATNIYIKATNNLRLFLLKKIGLFISKILKVFGLIDNDSIGFASSAEHQGSFESEARPFFDAFLNFRNDVRTAAFAKAPYGEILALSDKLRDETLVSLGLKLTDSETRSVWALVDPKELQKEAVSQRMVVLFSTITKNQSKVTKLKSDIERMEGAKIAPSNMFSTTEYSKFNSDGIPSHTVDGKEITPSAAKKLKKMFMTQQKNYKQYLEKYQANPNFLANMEEDLKQTLEAIKTAEHELSLLGSDNNE